MGMEQSTKSRNKNQTEHRGPYLAPLYTDFVNDTDALLIH